MIVGILIQLQRIVALAALVAVPTICSATPDVDVLISGLARRPPTSIVFTEARFSPLLREPIFVSGELGYVALGSLDRRVTRPYQETTAIRGESVLVERPGETPRTFALKRAPELRGLINGFTAMLSGDPAAVRMHFSAEAGGDDESWNLRLTPVERSTRRRVEKIYVTGSRTEPRCIATFNTEDGASVMLLGAAAATELPRDVTLASVLAICRAE